MTDLELLRETEKKLVDMMEQRDQAISTLTLAQKALRQSEAGAAVMRQELEEVIEWAEDNNSDQGDFKSFVGTRDIDEAMSTEAGKALLAELDQCKARLVEAEWLIENALPGMFASTPSKLEWRTRQDKWLAEGKVK